MTREEQKGALTAEIMRDYAEGRVAWKQLQHRLGVTDYDLVLIRLGEEGLKLPRADAKFSELGIARLQQAMTAARTGRAA